MAHPPEKKNTGTVKAKSGKAKGQSPDATDASTAVKEPFLKESAKESDWIEMTEMVEAHEMELEAMEKKLNTWHPHTHLELDEEATRQGMDINLGGRRMGGPTGGDFSGGGRGPALGKRHPADDSTAEHYGSRAETQAALEEKIANLNTRQLRGKPFGK